MALILNILLAFISVGIFSGRIYELMNLTNIETNFLTFKGVIFNPYILPIFIIITVCCGVLILGDIKAGKSFFAKSAGIFSIFAGSSFLIYIIMTIVDGDIAQNNSLSQFLFFLMLGAIGFIGLGMLGLRSKKYEIAIVSILTVFCIGLCLNVIVFNVSSIYNVTFLKESLAILSIVMFLLMVFKNVYSPSRSSIMWLYISGFVCFVLCGVMYLADIAYGCIENSISVSSLFLYTGYVFIGLYAVSTAILAIPNGKIEISIKPCEPAAWNSIKMLAQTQEIDIKEKLHLTGIALKEIEYKAQHENMNQKTATYNIMSRIILDPDETDGAVAKRVKEKRIKERPIREKAVKEKPIREKVEKIRPVKEEKKKSFKAEGKKSSSSAEKVVYKRPQG